MSELLPICIILIVLAAILYLSYSAATVYLSEVHNTRPHNAAVCICCLLAVLSICLNGAYGVDATGLLFLSILTGLLTVMTLTDIAVCRLPRIFTLSLIILGAAFRYSRGLTGSCPAQRVTVVRHDIPVTTHFFWQRKGRKRLALVMCS